MTKSSGGTMIDTVSGKLELIGKPSRSSAVFSADSRSGMGAVSFGNPKAANSAADRITANKTDEMTIRFFIPHTSAK
jgi:hypothetical protein